MRDIRHGRHQRSIGGTLLAGTILTLAGCAGGSLIGGPTASNPATPATPATATERPAAAETVVFNGGGGPASDASTAARPMAVGLFGEFVTSAPSAAGPADGASNLRRVTHAAEGSDFDPDVDPTGRWIVYASTQHRTTADLYVKPIDGNTITQLTNDPADDVMPAYSPNGSRVAFASNRGGNWDIFLMPAEGGAAVQITDDAAHEVHPSWSPDGRHLAYSRFGEQSGRWEIWVVEPAKPGVKHFLEYGLFPEFSPDPTQSKILFQRARERGSRYHGVWTIDFENGRGGSPTEIVSARNAAAINPAWSPDGRRVVFATVVEPEAAGAPVSNLWVVDLDGGGRTSLTKGEESDFQPVWSSDGRVYFVSSRSGRENIWSVAPTGATASDPSGRNLATVPEDAAGTD